MATTRDDPHVVTFRGDRFDFMGEHGKWYNFISTKSFSLNLKMETFEADRTYISAVGICLGPVEQSRKLSVSLDGKLLAIDIGDESKHVADIAVKPKKSLRVFTGVFDVAITRGIEMYEQIEFPHINVEYNIGKLGVLSEGVVPHGVMGQFATRLKGMPQTSNAKQGEGFIDGVYQDYEVSGQFEFDFKFNRFGSEPTETPQMGVGYRKTSVSFL